MTQTVTPQLHRLRARRIRRVARGITLAGAAAIAVLIWVISTPVLGIELIAGSGASAQTVGLLAAAVVPLIVGGLAWALLALLEKLGRAGRLAWQIIGWTVLAVSLLGPLTMTASLNVLVCLALMHLCVGVTLIVGFSAAGRNAYGRQS